MPNRRDILRIGAAGLAATALPMRLALAGTAGDRRLVVVILRGAMDGLAAVPPYADPDYNRLRGVLALAEPGRDDGIIDLDGRFGLHPELAFLGDSYRKGELAVLHAAATPYRERSHFDGQDVLENGAETALAAEDGWLNRALALFGKDAAEAGIAIAQSPPLMLRGAIPVGSWAPAVLPAPQEDFMRRLTALYDADPLLGPPLHEALRVQTMTGDMTGEGAAANRRDALADLAAMTEPAGRMLAEAHGPRVAVFELGGWDTHANQGAGEGQLANQFKRLDRGLAALRESMGAAWRHTAVLAVTEFGRTAAVNGTNGTDHGTGSAAFLLGGAVAGGRIVGDWPGLADQQLYQGRDVAPVTDLRAVFAAALTTHLGLPAGDVAARVFPGGPPAGAFAELFRA